MTRIFRVLTNIHGVWGCEHWAGCYYFTFYVYNNGFSKWTKLFAKLYYGSAQIFDKETIWRRLKKNMATVNVVIMRKKRMFVCFGFWVGGLLRILWDNDTIPIYLNSDLTCPNVWGILKTTNWFVDGVAMNLWF